MSQTEVIFNAGEQPLNLKRYPYVARENLRAWDAADEFLVRHVREQGLASHKRMLIFNDNFGALTLSFASENPSFSSDSHLSHAGTLVNAEANGIDLSQCRLMHSLENPTDKVDLVLIKVALNQSYLEDFLHRIRRHVHPATVIIGAGMSKFIHTSTLELFETIIGPTTTSLAEKKARLIFCKLGDTEIGQAAAKLSEAHEAARAKRFVATGQSASNLAGEEASVPGSVGEERLPTSTSPYPITLESDALPYPYMQHANVFCSRQLDMGTAFMLDHLPRLHSDERVADLGCGNGLLGIEAARRHGPEVMHFFDESYMAIESARLNAKAQIPDVPVQFHWNDCMTYFDKPLDVILCNPPFHQGNVRGDHVAWRMLTHSYRVLRKGGRLRMVGNRHLQYHAKLTKIFGNHEVIASNEKFVILDAIR